MLKRCYQYSKMLFIASLASLLYVGLCVCVRLCYDFHTRTFFLYLVSEKKKREKNRLFT
jgi:hypothetical protein